MAKSNGFTSFAKSFEQLPLLIKVILLLIPGVNWIVEILVRLASFLGKGDAFNLLGLILAIIPPTGILLGWLDIIWIIFFGRYFLQKA